MAKLSNSKGDIMTDKQFVDEVLNDPVFLTLTLEDGQELKCEVLSYLEYKGKEYIAVLPEDEEEFWIYEYSENDDDTLNIDNVEDEKIFAAVGKLFEEIFDADEDFEDDDEDDDDDCDCDDCDDDDCNC